ncbi:MAG: hypothetical protein ACM3X7_10945 [Solirubrobacterales bacterium]
MDTSSAKVVFNSILGKISSIIGYCMGVFFLPGLFAYITDDKPDATCIMICLFFISIAAFLIYLGRKIKKTIKRFKEYVKLISVDNISSLEEIASSTSRSVDFVKNDIQKLIDKKYFINAYIDDDTDEIVIGEHNIQANTNSAYKGVHQRKPQETESVKCSGCGAMNYRSKGAVINCEYCGSLLK